ncbi:kinase-like domain-containing protein, partial [Thelephora terrestris]
KCIQTLQKVCGAKRTLPSSYQISGRLSLSSSPPIFGAFCNVHTGFLGPEEVGIKRFRVTAAGDPAPVEQALCEEAVVWKHLSHPNIVPFKGVTFRPLQLVSEWMPCGEIKEYIKENPQANLLSLLLGIAKGLNYLHSRNIIHGDLKGANIVVDTTGNAQILDFSLA